MSGFALYADQAGAWTEDMPRSPKVDPNFGEGFFRGTGQIFMREAFAKPARAASMAGAVVPIAIDAITGGTTLQDKYFDFHKDRFDSAVKFWTPTPGEVGMAAEIVGGLGGVLGQIMLSPHLAVSNQFLSQAEDLITQPGVTSRQALGVGAAQALGLGVGIWAPPALGYNLATKAATGAGVNLAQGVITRGASAAILGDNPAAASFPAFGGQEMLLDTLLGAAFGAASHVMPRWNAEVEAKTDAMWQARAARQIRAEIGDVTPFDLGAAAAGVNNRFAAAVSEWAKAATPSDVAALATLRVAKHLNVDSLPGRPTSPAAVDIHVAAMREAIQSMLADRPVTARVAHDDGSPIAPQAAETPARDILAQARQELDQGQEGPYFQELAAIAADPADPRRAELIGNLHPEIAAMPERPADPAQAQIWDEIHQPAAERAPGQPSVTDDLVAAVRRWDPESPVFHVKQPSLFEPVPDPTAAPRLAAMREEAARIAREEGLPPPEREAIDVFIARSVEEAGRPREEAALHGVKWKAIFDSFARAAGVDPTELFYRYMDRVVGYGTDKTPDAATTLMQEATRPANQIERYRPTIKTAAANRLPIFDTEIVAMGHPNVMSSSAISGKRISWLIYDRRGGTATKVGFVIADLDPATNKFLALQNIELDPSVRGSGIGEGVVAMMLAHNGDQTMRVVDITHAGRQGTPEDALPFWKKLGTVLDNYSSDPNVQMDGRITLADYLGARRGQRPAAGRGNDAAQAVPADAQGSRGGADGTGRPRGADTLFQSPTGRWYYSALSAAIDAAPPRAQNAGTWKQWLQAQINAGRIKETEVEWVGLREYLDTQQGKITQQQLQQFMENGGVRVEEVELGKQQPPMDTEGTPRGWAVIEGGGTRFDTYQLPGAKEGSYRELALTLPARPDEPSFDVPLQHSMGDAADTNRIAHIRFNERVTGQTPIEDIEARILQAVPNAKGASSLGSGAAGAAVRKGLITEAEAADWSRARGMLSGYEKMPGTGKRVLFLEEIQSDWAQEGRKRGFTGKTDTTGWTAKKSQDGYARDWDIFDANGVHIRSIAADSAEDAIRDAADGGINQNKVPAGPFVGNTDAWTGLVMKRMIRYAAENGFDQIAWTRGEQQVERYASALRNNVDRIEWTKTPEGVHLQGYKGRRAEQYILVRDGQEVLPANYQTEALALADYQAVTGRSPEDDHVSAMPRRQFHQNRIMVIESQRSVLEEMHGDPEHMLPLYREAYRRLGSQLVTHRNLLQTIERESRGSRVVDTTQKETALSDAIGKAMAQQILEDPNQTGTIEGDNIRIDDAGMAGFYDRILPKVAKDVLRKLGGGNVTETTIDIPGTPKALPRLEPFTRSDFDVFQGAERFDNGDPPMMGETRLLVDGKIRQMTMVMDRGTVQFFSPEGDLAVLYDSTDLWNVGAWSDSQENATAILAQVWSRPERWRNMQVIMGDADEVRPTADESSQQMAIEITPAVRDKAMQIVHMEQARERGFLQIGDGRKMLIGLAKDADASTFMHESAHFFLEVMDDLSITVPALKADMEVLFKEWGITRADWDQMDLNGKRPYHEMFAESFEVYLMTNKAPTPALRTVFQRFRDWLLDVYQAATATGRKVSQPMRDLFDRMLDAQRREQATAQAAEPTPGPPPPPQPGESRPPVAVDPFNFEANGEPQPPKPMTLEDQDMRELIREVVEKEAGWYQIGGRNVTGQTGVANFSEWIPNGPWWTGRPDKKMNAQMYINAVAKALVGDKLKPMEQRAVQYLLDHLNERRVEDWRAAKVEWDKLSEDLVAEGIEPTPASIIDLDAVARATAIDEAAVERLALQYGDDDVGFMAEVRRIIDDQSGQTVQGGQEGGAAPAEGTTVPGGAAAAAGDGKPPAQRVAGRAGEAGSPDPLAREADRVAMENPSMLIQFEQPDGQVVRMTAAQYLEQVRMEAELARQDMSLLTTAAECMLGAMT